MGSPEHRADARAGADARYGAKPGPGGGSNEPVFDPHHRPARDAPAPEAPARDAPAPEAPARDAPAPEAPVRDAPARSDLTLLLGRTVLEERTQRICREWGLIPRAGAAGALSRSYLSRDAGVEIAADLHGTVTTVFLHFRGDDGFASFHGEMPAGAGAVPRRTALRAALGEPHDSGDAYRERFLGDFGPWDRWLTGPLVLHAQYGLDGESLCRITLTRP